MNEAWIERIVYVSRAHAGVGAAQAYDIIRTAHNRNARDGLTGALLFIEGWFVQVLEGDPYHVDRCFQSILRDPRHHGIELRQRVRQAQRRFPSDWMALRLDAGLSAGLKRDFDYRPGLPAAQFTPERLLDFVQACCALEPA